MDRRLDEIRKKVLSDSDLTRLLTTTKPREDVANKWPGHNNMIRLAKAVESKAPQVVLTDGMKYDIAYNKENVHIKPSTGQLVPRGYIAYYKLREALAEEKTGVTDGAE